MEISESAMDAAMEEIVLLPHPICHHLQHDLEEFFATRLREFNLERTWNLG